MLLEILIFMTLLKYVFYGTFLFNPWHFCWIIPVYWLVVGFLKAIGKEIAEVVIKRHKHKEKVK